MPKERAVRGQAAQADKENRCSPFPVTCKEGKGIRSFSCLHYDICLDKAAKAMWSGFTCRECSLYHQKDEEKAQQ